MRKNKTIEFTLSQYILLCLLVTFIGINIGLGLNNKSEDNTQGTCIDYQAEEERYSQMK